ncbi:DNA-directed RNA polymerase subunit alpha [Candidatus Daviesbacteria bacterium]|nr:DNA-directed RNA polymerase subunit alpha [Candidatus Daviesbacteria bacterium]
MINFKVGVKNQTNTEGTFELEPLERGFGHTVGNCLRRVLLTSLEGAAITSIKIDGVSHNFSTIPGMSEDVIELILNLKQVRIKLYSDKPVNMTLQYLGKGEVKAKDIETAGAGEVVNPELHLASLNDSKAKLKLELTVEKGTGFVMADDKKTTEIGVLPIDALYSPVLSVSYDVEQTRVGRKTDFDKLVVSIKTDGTIKPEEALLQAARILSAYFKQIYEPTLDDEIVPEQQAVSDEVLKMSVEELDLPVRITNALRAVDIDTVEKLISTEKSQLIKAKNLGAQSLALISEKLAERGLTLSEA